MTDDPDQLIQLMDALQHQIMLVRHRMATDKKLLAGLVNRYQEIEARFLKWTRENRPDNDRT